MNEKNHIIDVKQCVKTYGNNFTALDHVDLKINKGEVFALLGPNGAGKTTLINIICGITTRSAGDINVNGYDIIKDYRKTRSMIGLVPQELTTEAFETVIDTVNFSRGLFGKEKNQDFTESLLAKLSLSDKKYQKIMTLSGGMKRRLMIAKALSHEPIILFLDEPTAGVDVELRQNMWEEIKKLKDLGVTIILTTHYIEEAEAIADRIGIINRGKIILIEKTKTLLKKLGLKTLIFHLREPINKIPDSFLNMKAEYSDFKLSFQFNPSKNPLQIQTLLKLVEDEKIVFDDIETKESTLEEIFVNLVNKK